MQILSRKVEKNGFYHFDSCGLIVASDQIKKFIKISMVISGNQPNH